MCCIVSLCSPSPPGSDGLSSPAPPAPLPSPPGFAGSTHMRFPTLEKQEVSPSCLDLPLVFQCSKTCMEVENRVNLIPWSLCSLLLLWASSSLASCWSLSALLLPCSTISPLSSTRSCTSSNLFFSSTSNSCVQSSVLYLH